MLMKISVELQGFSYLSEARSKGLVEFRKIAFVPLKLGSLFCLNKQNFQIKLI